MIKFNYDIKKVSYIKVGGIVKGYLETESIEDILSLDKKNNEIKYIGETSNILFAFNYSPKIYVKFKGEKLNIYKGCVEVESGMKLNKFASFTSKNKIEGFQNLGGIPGRIGGGLINNSSCLNSSLSSLLLYVICLDENNSFFVLKKEELFFSYRNSSLKNKNIFIYKAIFSLSLSEEDLYKKFKESLKKKISIQDYSSLSLGSTFKNNNYLAGKELDLLKMKGYQIGNAKISEKHANFILINNEKEYENIVYLIETMFLLLYNKLGVYFENEIEIIGGD